MKTLLFACIHNAGRSQMAAALFNSLVDPLKARAVSAGTAPGERVHPEVVQVMRELGSDLSAVRPTLLTDELARTASLLVTMGCGEACPFVPGLERRDWNLEDPKGKPLGRVREIRDEIRGEVETLIDERGWGRRARGEKPCVLFICTHNAARSQMAEALLRCRAADRFRACSAGFTPTEVHPLTRQVLAERGIDGAGLRAKPLQDFLGKATVRHAIIVCEQDEESCPQIFPFAVATHHWAFADPTEPEDAPELQLAKFRRVRDQIEKRLEDWLEEEG